jgi:hypothetical protein
MSRRLLILGLALSAVSTWPSAKAQSLCPAGVASDKLICVIPQVFGPNGLVLPTANVNLFQNSAFTSALRPLNSAIGRQSALLPLASPASGIRFTPDPVSKLPVPSTDSFGPILGERAETIGRHSLYLGFDYQYFKFDSLDGLNLKSLPVVLTQPDFVVSGTNCSIHAPDGPQNTGDCVFIRDTIKTNNRVNLKIHQYTTFITFGLTSRLDVSLIIPIESVRMSVDSDATIVNNSNSLAHTFDIEDGVCGSFTPPTPCPNHSFSNARNASGIADMTLRVKGTVMNGERAAVALGVDVRMPTGDALNFTGAGAWGVKPFVVVSYRSRFSPHAFLGYEVNGSSVIVGDISTGSKERLPSQLSYSGGVDVWLTRWLTGAFDVVGQQVFETERVSSASFPEPGACQGPLGSCNGFAPSINDATLSTSTGTLNITNLSFGMKIKPVASFLITANVLVRANHGGLRADVTPLVGLSYTF